MGDSNNSKVDYWRTPEKLMLIECWARDDYSIKDITEKMGITQKTFIEWRKQYKEIDEALRAGKEETDYRVENALLKSAVGYKVTETKTIISPPDKDGNRKFKIEKIEKEIPPNPTSALAWLNNRKPDLWKRNRDNFINDKSDSNITVNIIRHDNKDNEEWDVNTNTSNKTVKNKKQKSEAKKVKSVKYNNEELEWLNEED